MARGVALVVGVAIGATLIALARLCRLPTAALLRGLHELILWCFNLRVHWRGAAGEALAPPGSAPVLFVANHVSYLDVFALGASLDASFTAKSEVAGWPVLGKLATLQDTLFLRRDPRRAREQVAVLRTALRKRSHVLFAEGTSTPGTMVEPFRSSLLAAADEAAIVPLTIAYTHYDGEPMTDAERDRYAWYLPMPFGSHFLHGLGRRAARVEVTVHQPVTLAEFGLTGAGRKACAQHCETVVRGALLNSLGLEREIVPTHYLEATGRG
ncbi:MAG: lysophospholipid acyltransferase family protein [Pseudomonadota bacterium]